MADNVILPRMARLDQSTTALKTTTEAFVAAPSASKLGELKESWKAAFLAYQYCAAFNFGPGELPIYGSLHDNVAIFPTNTQAVEAEVLTGPTTGFYADRRGFLALEYLLFASDDAATVAFFSEADGKRSNLLKAIVADLQGKIHAAAIAWPTYREAFIANDGTDAGSSTAQLFNAFNAEYEFMKNYELGLPLGLRPGQTSPEPTKIETRYAPYGPIFLLAQIDAINKLWLGKTEEGQDGLGFDDYLATVVGGPILVTASKTQYAALQLAASKVPNQALSTLFAREDPSLLSLHTEVQKQARYFKSDMASLLGIAITFQSGDGD
jgi:predicted lipoprotein